MAIFDAIKRKQRVARTDLLIWDFRQICQMLHKPLKRPDFSHQNHGKHGREPSDIDL